MPFRVGGVHTPVRGLVLALALVVVAPTTVWAHPGFAPSSVVAGEPTEVELAVAHGCELPGGGIEPTTVVALQVPEQVAEVRPLDRDGWTSSIERDPTGLTAVIEWTALPDTVESEPPTFGLVVTGDTLEAAATLPFTVYQGCETGDHLWGAGDPDEPPVDLEVLPGVYVPPARPTPSSNDVADDDQSPLATTRPRGLSTDEATATASPPPAPSTAAAERQNARTATQPTWVVPVLLGTLGLLVVLGLGAWWSRRPE